METFPGKKLVGRRYVPPFDYYYDSRSATTKPAKLTRRHNRRSTIAWRVVPADFVTVDSGTGVVHQAPAFGEVDFEVLLAEQARFVAGEGPELICAVGPDGKFTAEAPDYQGRWVKEADKDISRELRASRPALPSRAVPARISVLLAGGGRSADPVSARELVHPHHRVQRADAGEQRQINWLPEHIRTAGSAIFWNRTSIGPCRASATGARRCRSGFARTTGRISKRSAAMPNCSPSRACKGPKFGKTAKTGQSRTVRRSESPQAVHRRRHLRLGPRAAARMRRVPEVIDCWFDSGAMPFAQWGYPHQGRQAVPRAVSGRFHQRGDRSDPRLVLQPAGDQHAAVGPTSTRPRRPRSGRGSG